MVLATGNPGKVRELRLLLPANVRLQGLADLGIDAELPETGETLDANARQKAEHVFRSTGLPSIADDTGLEVAALGGEPGVFSARYAGPQKSAEANMSLLLDRLGPGMDRRARFRTVIALASTEGTRTFEGVVEGRIATERRGTGGFGYDPIFIPQGTELSFAEMDPAEKNRIGHRGRAMRALLAHLRAQR